MQLPVAVDVCGADSGVDTVVQGALAAVSEFSVPLVLVGNEDRIRESLSKESAFDSSLVSIVHAPEEITMSDSPSAVLRSKPQSSMRLAFGEVAENRAAAVVSAGNTGAMMAAGLSIFGSFSGIVRPAIASSIPNRTSDKLTVLLDSGANVQCDAQQLSQFAIMGSCFARIQAGISSPKVGILSNGSEPSKGTSTTRSAAELLSQVTGLNFVGYVEGGDLFTGEVDVVVCDGFVGNIALKTLEGMARIVVEACLHELSHTDAQAKSKRSFHFSEKFDPTSYGGAPLLGLQGLAVVCHGSSDSRAIKRAVALSSVLAQNGLVDMLKEALGANEQILPTGTD